MVSLSKFDGMCKYDVLSQLEERFPLWWNIEIFLPTRDWIKVDGTSDDISSWTPRFHETDMSTEKYSSIFPRQTEADVYLFENNSRRSYYLQFICSVFHR